MYGRSVALVALCLLLQAPAHAAERVLVCFGDSITAGYGLSPNEAYPALLQKRLDAGGYRYKVVSHGVSGATTKDAVAALPEILRLRPEIVIVEFGGNDGLRGLPLAQTRSNLDRVLTALENAHVKVLLAGITLPPDYGLEYIRSFEQMFRSLAATHRVTLEPMLYRKMAHAPGTIQADGIHPTAKGSAMIADTLMADLRPMLRR